MAYRLAIRKTQKQVDAQKRGQKSLDSLSYRELQERATAAGIPAKQSADALRKALSE